MDLVHESVDLGVIVHCNESGLIIVNDDKVTEIDSPHDEKSSKAFFFLACLATPRLKIIALNKKVPRIKHSTCELRKNIKKKYNSVCLICGSRFEAENLSIHHIRALSAGGNSIDNNLVPLCTTDHSRLHEFMACIENWFVKELEKKYYLDRQMLVMKSIYVVRAYLDNFFDHNIKFRKLMQNEYARRN